MEKEGGKENRKRYGTNEEEVKERRIKKKPEDMKEEKQYVAKAKVEDALKGGKEEGKEGRGRN